MIFDSIDGIPIKPFNIFESGHTRNQTELPLQVNGGTFTFEKMINSKSEKTVETLPEYDEIKLPNYHTRSLKEA